MENPPFRKHERRAVNTASSGLQVRRILVPIDFRDTTVVALQYAAAFARQYKATITLLHIVEPDGSELRRNISSERLIEEMSEVGERQIRKLVDVIWGDEIVTDIVVAGGKPHHSHGCPAPRRHGSQTGSSGAGQRQRSRVAQRSLAVGV